MWNILLDEYPQEWNGYKLNTDFRIGIMISMASVDKELTDAEKIAVVVDLLFENDYPSESTEIVECVQWFLNDWTHDHHKKSSGVEVMSFDADQGRIYSAFLSQYHIDLSNESMHFWRFMNLITNLEECTFTRVIDIRGKKLDSKMSKEERKYYANAKRTYSIDNGIIDEEAKEEEREATEEFLKFIGKR